MEEMEVAQNQKSFNPMLILGGILAVAVIGGGVWWMNRSSQVVSITDNLGPSVPQVEGVTTESTPTTDESSQMDSGRETFNVEGGSFYFSPNEIRVKQGDTVKIVFTNAGGTHDFVIDEFNVKTHLTQTSETAEVEFVADKAGEFEFYCSVGNHRALGMKGTLIVE